MTGWRVIEGDAFSMLRSLPAESVQTCCTSPPYFGLRDYGTDSQIGLEPTPNEYVARLVEVFREVRRVLRDDGTLWLNLGDSYNAYNGNRGSSDSLSAAADQARNEPERGLTYAGCKPKDLLGIPWMVAFALRADGWYLRSDIVWAKPNPMPESVTDRPTKSHEYLFLLSKGPRYYFDSDAIREEDQGTDHPRSILDGQPSLEPTNGLMAAHKGLRQTEGRNGAGRNKRSVWTVPTHPFPGAHFAVFPPKLIEPCILAGSSDRACGECGAPWERVVEDRPAESYGKPQGPSVEAMAPTQTAGVPGAAYRSHGASIARPAPATVGWNPSCSHNDDQGSSVVLDPFAGAGTTGLVATRHGRSFVGIELNPEYAEMARQRIRDDAPLMNYVSELAA